MCWRVYFSRCILLARLERDKLSYLGPEQSVVQSELFHVAVWEVLHILIVIFRIEHGWCVRHLITFDLPLPLPFALWGHSDIFIEKPYFPSIDRTSTNDIQYIIHVIITVTVIAIWIDSNTIRSQCVRDQVETVMKIYSVFWFLSPSTYYYQNQNYFQ